MKDITIYCVNLQKSVQVREGLTLLEIYRLLGVELPHQVLCARVNNKTEDLNYCVYNPKQIEFIDITHGSGTRAYVRSLCFVLYKAIEDTMPGMQLRIEHSISKGYYCGINVHDKISEETIVRIKRRMREIVDADMPFERIECPTKEALEIFRSQGMED